MAVNLIVIDGVVKSMALRFDANAKPELRFTLVQTDQGPDGTPWTSYWPCCASGSAATRLAEELEDGQHIIVTSGKLCYRKRTTKAGEQSRMEILVWTVDRLSASTGPAQADVPESTSGLDEPACNLEAPGAVPGPKARKPRLPKRLQQPWVASRLEASEN